MSLILGLNLNDYAILASDKRGFVQHTDGTTVTELLVLDNCEKLRKVPFGFFAAAGDYLMAECFYVECTLKTPKPCNLEEILQNTHNRYCQLQGISHFQEKTTIALIVSSTTPDQYEGKDAFLKISIDQNALSIEAIEPMSFIGAMAEPHPDPLFWDKIGSMLRPLEIFEDEEAFFNYHLDLVRYIWQEQLAFDRHISHHIDFYYHNRRTGKGLFFRGDNVRKIRSDTIQAISQKQNLIV